jgi:drug/metabolite transporter (DMT)-like permease
MESKDPRLFFSPVTPHQMVPLTMAHARLTIRQYLILALVAVCAPLGDTCLSRGMTHMPAISVSHSGALIAAVFTPWIGFGIALLIAFFASYLTALSWADLTFVLPATAFGNVIVALLARFWLHEPISVERWAGIALITVGVGFVAQGPSLTQRQAVADGSANLLMCGPDATPAKANLAAAKQEQPR